MKASSTLTRPAPRKLAGETGPAAELARGLAGVLADTYSVYLLTQNYHWNVEGPHFAEYHALFNKQYDELAGAVDELAEAIRSMGYYAPGTFAEFSELASVKQPSDNPDAVEMVRRLHDAHDQVLRRIGDVLPLSEAEGFEWVNDLLVQRQDAHGKVRWMLRATLGKGSQRL
ncbi:MAG: DNA starvation/stationary phase protection protein [Planctomycetota bacterium]|nr:MAG: DNA starvation/stationary phase protection protein [Planctomycetota bacterium]